jgi:hypothetical protein
MNGASRRLARFALGVLVQAGFVGSALAQNGSPPASYPDAGPDQGDAQEPEPASPAADLPVLYVTSVEVLETAVEPRIVIVRVTGLASSAGWGAPQLVPTYAGKPSDAVLDLQFIAAPPAQSQSASGFLPLGAIFPLDPGQPFKGVRVRAAENAITVKQIPGVQQTPVTVHDCGDCVGRKFLAEGQDSSGEQNVVREGDLPRSLRVVRPADGIRGAAQDPNRLTLILDDGDTIVEAFWE